jgi:outer membrane cobalamin receptor
MKYLLSKKVFMSIALALGIVLAFGQGKGPNAGSGPQGIIIGQIVDQQSNQELEYATVSIFSVKDSSLVNGAITDKKGRFSISGVPSGSYYVKVNFMGYEPYYSDIVNLTKKKSLVDLGEVVLVLAAENLNEVTVTGRADYVVNKIDRKAYNISKLMVAQDGNAGEVLSLIPSVEVDIDGNVSLRGSGNVTILIDGRPSGISGDNLASYLESLPANTLETVEVITNPSAKYDPDGMVGILNIVTKKKKLQGVHGTFSASTGMPARHNLSAMFNAKKGKWNFLFNGGVNYRGGFSIGETERTNLISGTTLSQSTDGDRKGPGGMLRLGLDYSLTPKSTLSAGASYNLRNFTMGEEITTVNAFEDGTPFDLYVRDTERKMTFDMFRYNLRFKHQFNNDGHELSIDANQSVMGHEFSGAYEEMPLSLSMEPLNYISFQQNNRTLSDNKTSTVQVDYTLPFSNNSALEAGYKSIFRNDQSDFYSESFDSVFGVWADDTNLINDFIANEQIHAVYGVYKQNIKKFGYQVGLRVEQAVLDAELVTTKETFHNDYFSLFPTVHFNYWLPKNQQLKASYSRRLNRPRHRVLNPFADYSDPYNIRKGNPFILPEYIDSYEVEYEKIWDKYSITTGVYYKQINKMISRIKTVEGDISTTTYANLGTGKNYGVELVIGGDLTKWWNFTWSTNGYRTELIGAGENSELNADGYAFTTKILSNMYLPKKFNVQLSANYRSPKVLAQGEISEVYSVDFALSKKVMDDKGTISLRVRDIFNTRSYEFVTEGVNFYQESYRKRQSQSVQLGFSYSFGRFKNMRGGRGGRDGGGMEGDDIEID